MPVSSVVAVIFFMMLITLGLGSVVSYLTAAAHAPILSHVCELLRVVDIVAQFPSMECLMTGFCDEFPSMRKYKTWLTLGTCVVLFLLGLPCVTEVKRSNTELKT